jgi:hypothetical protein
MTISLNGSSGTTKALLFSTECWDITLSVNKKFEIRISKFEINPNFKIQKMSIRFGHFDLESRLDGTCLGFRLPARSRSGEGRDFVLRICDF